MSTIPSLLMPDLSGLSSAVVIRDKRTKSPSAARAPGSKALHALVCLALLSVFAPGVHAGTPDRTPPRLQEYREESFQPYRTPDRQTDGYEMKLPYQLGSWELTDPVFRDKDDKRNDLALVGARPTLVFVLGWYLRFNIGSQNAKPSESEQRRQDKLTELLKELNEHAKTNRKKYDVLVTFQTAFSQDREAIRKVFKDAKTEYLDFAELAPLPSKPDSKFVNYWSNLIQTPSFEMIKQGEKSHPLGSWLWMATPGTVEAWGVWGNDSELSRLQKWERESDMPKALKISDRNCREIAELMAHWQLEDADKALVKLEKKADKGDSRNLELLREFEASLEQSYRENIAGVHKQAGYLVEYANALEKLGEDYFGKRSERGKAIIEEVKTYRDTDEYIHVEKAKKDFEKLSDRIYAELNGNLHGQDYAKHHARIMAKNKKAIDKFNEDYGDTPYAETTRRWASDAGK